MQPNFDKTVIAAYGDARLDQDFAVMWAELPDYAQAEIGSILAKRIYGAGWYDGGSATMDYLKASAPTKAPGDGGLQAVFLALHTLWVAEVAYDRGIDGASRKTAWAARNAALDVLAKLNPKPVEP